MSRAVVTAHELVPPAVLQDVTGRIEFVGIGEAPGWLQVALTLSGVVSPSGEDRALDSTVSESWGGSAELARSLASRINQRFTGFWEFVSRGAFLMARLRGDTVAAQSLLELPPPIVIELRVGPCNIGTFQDAWGTRYPVGGVPAVAYYPPNNYLSVDSLRTAPVNPRDRLFVPFSDRPVIKVCWSDLNFIAQAAGSLGVQEEYVLSAVLDFAVYHEAGHAIIDLWRLPITGREEDAADQFATLLLLSGTSWFTAHSSPVPDEQLGKALLAADFWGLLVTPFEILAARADSVVYVRKEPFSDEHSMYEQRYYNTLCWLYGAQPDRLGFLVDWNSSVDRGPLPRERARRCPAEYELMRRAWEEILAGKPLLLAPPGR
jgi:hypothetical protein